MNDRITVIKVANFTKYPGGRYREDGPGSGQEFRDDYLAKHLQRGEKVIVNFDGVAGAGSGFLEEAFGGLVRECGLTKEQLLDQLALTATEEGFEDIFEIAWSYIEEESQRKSKQEETT